MSEFFSWMNPIFLKCYVIFAKCAFGWAQIRAILKNNLNSSSKLVIALFITPDLIQERLPCCYVSKGASLCASVHFLHSTGLFFSPTYEESVRLWCLPVLQPQTHSGFLRSHSHFILPVTFLREGRLILNLVRTIRSVLSWNVYKNTLSSVVFIGSVFHLLNVNVGFAIPRCRKLLGLCANAKSKIKNIWEQQLI